MSTKGNEFTRRTALKLTGGAVAAGFSMPWTAGGAFAQDASTLRAGIVGFNVINTLDPMKATLSWWIDMVAEGFPVGRS